MSRERCAHGRSYHRALGARAPPRLVTGLDFLKRSSQREFGKLILRKSIKTVATSCHILQLKCTKFRLGLCPRPRGGAYSAPQTVARFKGLLIEERKDVRVEEGQGVWGMQGEKGAHPSSRHPGYAHGAGSNCVTLTLTRIFSLSATIKLIIYTTVMRCVKMLQCAI